MLYHGGLITKEEYCIEQVTLQIKLADIASVYVNKILRNDNGTGFLTMAYEEVLYPVTFLAMKTYYGLEHTTSANFDITNKHKIFKRGGKTRQKGIPKVLLSLCDDIIPSSLDITQAHLSIVTHVDNAIKKYFTTQWDIAHFEKSYTYNTKKKNVTVLKFVERMRTRGIEIKPGSRFNVVHVKPSKSLYNIKGVKESQYVGDLIEFPSMVDNVTYFIDLEKYYDNTIAGQFASFCSTHPAFDDNNKSHLVNAKLYIDSVAEKYLNNEKTNHKFHKTVYKNTIERTNVLLKQLRTNTHNNNIVELRNIISKDVESAKPEIERFAEYYIKSSNGFISYDFIIREITILNNYIENLYNTINRNSLAGSSEFTIDENEIIAQIINKFRSELSIDDDNNTGQKKYDTVISNIIEETLSNKLGDNKYLLYIGDIMGRVETAEILRMQYIVISNKLRPTDKSTNKKKRNIHVIKDPISIHNDEQIDFSDINM